MPFLFRNFPSEELNIYFICTVGQHIFVQTCNITTETEFMETNDDIKLQMQLINKIRSVKRVYRQLAIHSSVFRKNSDLQCISGCTACCIKTDIEATVLEFLPAAYESYLDGSYEKVLESIEVHQNAGDGTCIFYQPLNSEGGCINYQNRGMVCRLFGFSSKLNKYGNREFVSCRFIKEMVNPSVLKSVIGEAPDMSAYYLKLFGIDPKLSIQYLPINEAIREALEIVIMHFYYRKKPA